MNNWQKMHKWLALLIGLQLLLWIVSGLLLNLVSEEYFDANSHRKSSPQAPLITADSAKALGSLRSLTTRLAPQLVSVEVLSVFDAPINKLIYKVTGTSPTQGQAKGVTTRYYWAEDLSQISLSPEDISLLAEQSYLRAIETGKVSAAQPLSPQPLSTFNTRFSTPLRLAANDTGFNTQDPVYEVLVSDTAQTRIYVNAASGQVLGHKNSRSDQQAWLFMLHFMDYKPSNGLSFNHGWTQVIALLSLLLGISGAALVVKRLAQGRFTIGNLLQILPARASTHTHLVHVHDVDGKHLIGLAVQAGMLIDTINHQAERIATQCGGGGTCGLCMVRFIDEPPTATESDHNKIAKAKLALGYRLSCQHDISHASKTHNINIALINRGQSNAWNENKLR